MLNFDKYSSRLLYTQCIRCTKAKSPNLLPTAAPPPPSFSLLTTTHTRGLGGRGEAQRAMRIPREIPTPGTIIRPPHSVHTLLASVGSYGGGGDGALSTNLATKSTVIHYFNLQDILNEGLTVQGIICKISHRFFEQCKVFSWAYRLSSQIGIDGLDTDSKTCFFVQPIPVRTVQNLANRKGPGKLS